MSGHALVVHGCGFTPRAERVNSGGGVPPHATGAREVLARAGVVDAARARFSDHAFEARELLRNIKMRPGKITNRRVRKLLHPRLEVVGAVKNERLIGIEGGHRGIDRIVAAIAVMRIQARGYLLLFVDQAREFLNTELVRLLDVDLFAEERARTELVGLAADGVLLGSVLRKLLKHLREFRVGLAREVHILFKLLAGRALKAGFGDEGGEETVGLRKGA